jgi:phosphate transport system substrate-binding protein
VKRKKRIKISLKIVCAALTCLLSAGALGACGGGAEFSAEGRITAVVREDGSGTKAAFMELIGLKGRADPLGVVFASNTASALSETESNVNALAYESLQYVTARVKPLTVDGAEATAANIRAGVYKLARPLSVVYKAAALNDPLNKAFFDFLKSSDAQTIIANKGYVGTADNAAAYAVSAPLSGTVNVSGSTSLQPLMLALASAFKIRHAAVTVNITGGGSGAGYTNARDGVSDFGMISEEFEPSKAEGCLSAEVARDGIAVIVNKANTYGNVSSAQLKSIYGADTARADKITFWKDLGGGS